MNTETLGGHKSIAPMPIKDIEIRKQNEKGEYELALFCFVNPQENYIALTSDYQDDNAIIISDDNLTEYREALSLIYARTIRMDIIHFERLNKRLILAMAEKNHEEPLGYVIDFIKDNYQLPKTYGYSVAERLLKYYGV